MSQPPLEYGPVGAIDVYFANTPNGQKIPIACEEMGLAYKIHRINISGQEQFAAAFLAISPNNKIPAIVDPTGPGGGPLALFESGAILQYLGNKTGQFYPTAPRARAVCEQWLYWQMAGLGPMSGQAVHFIKYAPERIPYAIERYTNEVKRLYGVLDKQLGSHPYVAGEYSIADMACYPWVQMAYGLIGISLADYSNVARWLEAIAARPAVKRAAAV